MNKFLSYFLIIILFEAAIAAFIFHIKDSTSSQNEVANASTVTGANINSSSTVSANSIHLKNIKTGALNVKDVAATPAAYKGTITINGVTTGVGNNDDKVFTIVDTAEAIAYQNLSNGMSYLLVKYNGEIPQEGYEVNITGSLTESSDNHILNATEIKIIRNVFLKGKQ